MDQMTSACGEENRLLELLCQPDILKGTLSLPDELELGASPIPACDTRLAAQITELCDCRIHGLSNHCRRCGLPVANLEDGSVLIDDSEVEWPPRKHNAR